jgi:hypothetical protein
LFVRLFCQTFFWLAAVNGSAFRVGRWRTKGENTRAKKKFGKNKFFRQVAPNDAREKKRR